MVGHPRLSARRRAQAAGYYVRRKPVEGRMLWFVCDGEPLPPELAMRGFPVEKDAWEAAAALVPSQHS